jgi:hypothetical protein
MHSSVDAVHYPLPSSVGPAPSWSPSGVCVVHFLAGLASRPWWCSQWCAPPPSLDTNGAPVHGTTSSLLRLPANQGGDSPGPAWGIPSLGQPNMEKDCEEAPLSPEASTVFGTGAEA